MEMQRRRVTAKQVWDGPRSGAETTLVYGTLRRRGTLDAILKAHSSRKLSLIRPEVLIALRVGLFEILYLDHAPTHAVVHEAVETVKSFKRFKDTGFVNALLRNIERGHKRVPHPEAQDPRRTLPRADFSLLFEKSVFPDRNHDEGAFLAARASTAPWIARRRLAELGFDRALRCLELQATTPRTHLRPPPGREAEAFAALEAAGISVHESSVAPGVRASDILEAVPDIFIQDRVAAQVAPFLGPAPGARILDYCAAPGGKATHLAQLVSPDGSVTAWDKDERRLALVAENAERLGLHNLRCESPEGRYAAALVDAPCSNTAVLARRPEARWRVKERHLPGMAERQLRILKDAAAFVEPGGVLVYATCSLEPEENGGVVEAFCGLGEFRLEEARTLYPDEAQGDGGFMARLRRV